jgi:hypothetical protein
VSTIAKKFFTSTVKPTVTEFLGDIRDIRRGRLAAIVLSHMADYWAIQGYTGNDRNVIDKRLDKLRVDLINDCPDFEIIWNIADATKHVRLTTKRPRKLSTSDQIIKPLGIFGAPFNTAVFNEASIVEIVLDNKKKRPLAGVIQSVFAMWERKLK